MSTANTLPLPVDRNGKVIRLGDTVRFGDAGGSFVVDAIKVFGDLSAMVFPFASVTGLDATRVEVVEEPFAERFRQGDIVTTPRFGRFGGDRLRVIGWVPERISYVAVRLDETCSLASIYESNNPTLIERAS